MTKLIVVATFLFAACGDPTPSTSGASAGSPQPAAMTAPTNVGGTGPQHQALSTEGLTGGPGQPSVDPTVPSWAPSSCIAYHKAVVEALDCNAIAQATRDGIQLEYGAASQRWKNVTDETPEKIHAVALACDAGTTSVHADTAGKCPVAKS